jgi:hypothetical protein
MTYLFHVSEGWEVQYWVTAFDEAALAAEFQGDAGYPWKVRAS